MGKTFLYGLAIMIKNNYLILWTLKQCINSFENYEKTNLRSDNITCNDS